MKPTHKELQVFLQPTTKSGGDHELGIINSVGRETFAKLKKEDFQQIEQIIGDGDFYAWAIEDGCRTYWNHMQRDDFVLFDIKPGQIQKAARLLGKLESETLSQVIWGTEKFTRKFPLVYIFSKPFNPKLSLEEFKRRTGYADLKMSQNFQRVDPARSVELVEFLEEAQTRALTQSDRDEDSLEDDLLRLKNRQGISETERENLCKCRIGQGTFREGVIDLWDGCDPILGIGRKELLRASHIRPWAKCDNDQQRLDPHNGLLLLPNHDHLFDQGWISFDSSGKILLSKEFTDRDYDVLGIKGDIEIDILSDRMATYLKYHRTHRYKG
jgi:hypothetical protein